MIYRVALETAPGTLPVTVSELKLQARTLYPGESDPFAGAEDPLLERLIDASVQELDSPRGYLGRSLMPRTLRIIIDSVPNSEILLPGPPVSSVESVQYYKPDGTVGTIAATDYKTDLSDTGWPAKIWHKTQWPETEDRPGRLWISYKAGYTNAAAVPSIIKQAILVAAATKYRDRESSVVGTIIAEHPHIMRALNNWRVFCAHEVQSWR